MNSHYKPVLGKKQRYEETGKRIRPKSGLKGKKKGKRETHQKSLIGH